MFSLYRFQLRMPTNAGWPADAPEPRATRSHTCISSRSGLHRKAVGLVAFVLTCLVLAGPCQAIARMTEWQRLYTASRLTVAVPPRHCPRNSCTPPTIPLVRRVSRFASQEGRIVGMPPDNASPRAYAKSTTIMQDGRGLAPLVYRDRRL